jgi:uncharacterized membrane protein YadS
MKKELLPGWALMAALGAVSMVLSNLVVAGGRHPLEATAVAVVLGLLLRNVGLVPEFFHPGIRQFERFLIWGVILIGATLNFKDIGSQGPRMLAIILITMTVSYFVIYGLARLFRLSPTLSTLFYPKIAQAFGVGDISFGVFAGTAIHATPQVVGAGFIFSDLAGKTATAVKLVRNCFMAPLAFFIAAWFTRTDLRVAAQEERKVNWTKAFPWFLFGYFIMAGLNTAGYFSARGISGLTRLGRFLIVISMAGIGLNTLIDAFKKTGLKPLLVGLLGALVVAGVSIALISAML